ncbi:MAG: two-component regulator propeller domain-containing protein, partial [Imperialibacter sp.]
MVQDNFGFLWVGTRDGLNKYDGDSFRAYLKKRGDSTSLNFNQIVDLELAENGDLWVGASNGLSYYDYQADQFSNYPFPVEDPYFREANDIFTIASKAVIISTTHGLLTFDIQQKTFEENPQFADFADMSVNQFHSSKQYGTWVATTKGLYIKKPGDMNWVIILALKSINHLQFEQSGVYISTSVGLFKTDVSGESISEITLPNNQRYVLATTRAKNGELWVACNQVVVLGDDDETVEMVFVHDRTDPSSLSENRAQTLYQTKDSVMWIGTFGYGMNRYNPDVRIFSYLGINSRLPLSSNYVSAIYTANDTIIY